MSRGNRAKKPKQGMVTRKESRENSERACREVQLLMTTAMTDELMFARKNVLDKLDAWGKLPKYLREAIEEELGMENVIFKMLTRSARYAKYYDDHLVNLKDCAESLYKSSNGEVDIRVW